MTSNKPERLGTPGLTVSVAAIDHGILPLRNRAAIYFVAILTFLPSVILGLAFRPLPATLVLVGCLAAIALIMRQSGNAYLDRPIQWTRLMGCVLLAATLFILGGETHVFFATADWAIRDAVLSDLVAHGFPIGYRIDGADYILRAPLGMYMVPALIGGWFGLVAAHVSLLAQNALFLGATFYFIVELGGWRSLAIMVAFAGVVIVPDVLRLAATHTVFHLTTVLDAWQPYWQYSSSVVQFFWVPNHALPGWWLAVLLLLNRRAAVDVVTIGLFLVGLAIWSPLAIVPTVPWLLYLAVASWREVSWSMRTWCGVAVAACFIPMLVYLVVGAGTIARGSAADVPDFAFWYILFITVQLPALFLVVVFWRRLPQELFGLIVLSGLVLLVLPFFAFGPSNDLVRRGSITPLAILAFAFGGIVINLFKERSRGAIVGLTLIVAALPSACGEISRAILLPRSAISRCSLIEASRASGNMSVPANYVAARNTVPAWLLHADATPMIAVSREVCSTDWDTN